MTAPLAGLLVLDFTTLLPGPLATRWLADVGARVIKVEPPGGDEMRRQPPLGADGVSIHFQLLNRGKECDVIDLKSAEGKHQIEPFVRTADILVEQFRPGVMARLGLNYEAVEKINPGVIYCSITGYGQTGPKSGMVGHDLNYLADTGLLSLAGNEQGEPQLPPVLIADIGGGTLPAVLNILLALRARDETGTGVHLDVSMTDALFAWASWPLAQLLGAGVPNPGEGLLNGGSPRYALYRTADGRHLAVACLEDRFWNRFCVLLGLAAEECDDTRDAAAVKRRVAKRIGELTSNEWEKTFNSEEACCCLVRTLEEAVGDEHYRERFAGRDIETLPAPISPGLCRSATLDSRADFGRLSIRGDDR